MLFNSYIFLLIFLPVTLLVFFLFGKKKGSNFPLYTIIVGSLTFYAYWNPNYLPLLIGSILINYYIGEKVIEKKKGALLIGIVFNLALLSYFKYTNFLIDNLNYTFGFHLRGFDLILPLGISFFTFQQMSYLIDANAGQVKERNLKVYAAFVMFFPQLIAGPIVRYLDVSKQLMDLSKKRYQVEQLCQGIFIFVIGLSKKVLVADSLEPFATAIFNTAERGDSIAFLESWLGAFLYPFQIYFDFSGYSDMAYGLALMFNIKIAVNFLSPYRSKNISEFWQRWHISLSVCFQRYLFNPIAMSLRKRENIFLKQQFPFLVTMTLIGLWHGAGWTFVLWGAVHGIYLMINYQWKKSSGKINSRLYDFFSLILTFISVVFVFVLFRAESLQGAWTIYRGMLGMEGVVFPYALRSWVGDMSWVQYSYYLFPSLEAFYTWQPLLYLFGAFYIVFMTKNSQEMLKKFRPNVRNLLFIAILTFFCFLEMNEVSVFLYYQF